MTARTTTARHRRARGEALVRMLARGALLAATLHASATLLRALTQLALARWLGAEELGTYLVALTAAGLLATAAGLGLPLAALRFLPAYAAAQDPDAAHAFVRFARRGTLGGALLAGPAGALALGVTGAGDLPAHALLAVAAATPPLALLALHAEVARSYGRIALALGPPYLLLPAVTLVLAWLLVGLGGLEVGGALAALVVAAFAVAAAHRLAVDRLLPRGALPGVAAARGGWLRVSLPLLGSGLFALVLAQGDVLVVGIVLGPTEAGVYAVAVRVGYLAGLGSLAVGVVALPVLARAHAAGDAPQLQRALTLATRLSLAAATAAALLLAVLAERVLGLFGAEFETGATVLRLVLIGQLLHAATGPLEQLLGATGHHDAAFGVYAAAAALHLGLTASLAATWGIEGAAAGSMLALVAWKLGLAALVARRLHVRGFVR